MATRQQFIFTNKTIGITTIQFKNISPFENVEKIVYFKETGLKGNWLKKEFRYSFDNVTWTSWRTFNQSNVTSIAFNDQPEFYIEIIYTRKNYNSADIEDLYIFYDSNIPGPIDPSVGDVNASTLNGEPGSFYLDRTNHVGPYTGLNLQNVVDGSTIGVYYGRADSSLGTTFYFKRVEGSGIIEVSESSTGIITIYADPSAVGSITYQNDDPTTEGVGGIPDNSTYFSSAKTFAQVMEDMFYPRSVPNLTNPSLTSFYDDKDQYQIIGSNLSIIYTANFSRGSINPQYTAASPFRSGNPNTYYYNFFGSTQNFAQTAITDTRVINRVVTQGVQTSTCYVSYDGGVQPFDSKGAPYLSPLPAGNSNTRSVTFEGVYPLYATTLDITILTPQQLYSMISEDDIEMTLVAEPPFGTDRQKFEIPNAWLTQPRPLVGVQFYSDFENAWKYFGGSAVDSLTYWTTSNPGNKIIQGNSVAYTRYTFNSPDKQGETLIRLKFS